jgi:predicted ATP pyrophosphatase (TIGR00289 family)
MKVGVLFSGGKDSTFAIYKAIETNHEIKTLITVISENPESYMYHVPNIELTRLQADAMGLPIILRKSQGEKEKELMDLKFAIMDAIHKYDIEGVVSGAIFSSYQRKRIDRICAEVGVNSICPLWKKRPKEMLIEMVDLGFKIVISAVAAGGLDSEWLGKEITKKTIETLNELHDTCHVCTAGEGGEFETLVLDAPFYRKKIEILSAEKIWNGKSGVYKVTKVTLIDKQ